MLLEKIPEGRDAIRLVVRCTRTTRVSDDDCEVGRYGQEIFDIAERGEGGCVERGEGVGLEIQIVVVG